jgi:HEAT repeat protein
MYNDIVIMLIAMFQTLFSDEYRTQQLVADLLDDDLAVASEAAEELGDIGLNAAVDPLLQMLEVTAQEILERGNDGQLIDLRQDIVRALGKIGDERAISKLILVMQEDADKGIRYEAANALLQVGTQQATNAVRLWKQG